MENILVVDSGTLEEARLLPSVIVHSLSTLIITRGAFSEVVKSRRGPTGMIKTTEINDYLANPESFKASVLLSKKAA